MKLLIVEDNPVVRRMIKSIVADLAEEIHECADGAAALATYAACRPDFVLMDIVMAGMDGIMATRQIRAADPAAQVIIVTSYDEADLREATRSAGACGYVLKENLLELGRLLQTPSR
jgi:CheY-like chemotaxis protein